MKGEDDRATWITVFRVLGKLFASRLSEVIDFMNHSHWTVARSLQMIEYFQTTGTG